MRHRTLAAAAVATVMLGLLSCDSSPLAPRLDQLSLEVVSGNGQTGVVGSEVAPLIVKVTSGGNPVPGQVLNFRVVSGNGSIYGGTELTDDHGIAQEIWTLGTDASAPQRVEVRAVESSTGAQKVFGTFTATAQPGGRRKQSDRRRRQYRPRRASDSRHGSIREPDQWCAGGFLASIHRECHGTLPDHGARWDCHDRQLDARHRSRDQHPPGNGAGADSHRRSGDLHCHRYRRQCGAAGGAVGQQPDDEPGLHAAESAHGPNPRRER